MKRYWRSRRNLIRKHWRHWLWRIGLYRGVVLLDDGRILIAGWSRWPRKWRAIIAPDPCVYCGGKSASKDHLVPIARGGKGGLNLVRACKECNTAKATKSLVQFLIERRQPNRRMAKKCPSSQRKRERRIVRQWQRAQTLTSSLGEKLKQALGS